MEKQSNRLGLLTQPALWLLAMLLCFYSSVWASILILPQQGNLVGEPQYTQAEPGDTLSDIARRFDMGYLEMRRANPEISDHHPIAVGQRILIPSQFVLPDGPRAGIVVNLSDYRLYYYPPNENLVMTYPVGIGRAGWDTPTGISKVIEKQVNPIWRPTKKIKAQAAKQGLILPSEFPSNEANPLGKHILRLSWPTYLLHGTQRPEGVGARVSAGCLRMYPEDIEHLYELVGLNTTVRIIQKKT